MRYLTSVAVVFSLLLSSGARSQDGSLQITVALDTLQTHSSASKGTWFLVEYRNTLAGPLRWLPPYRIYQQMGQPNEEESALCIERADGTRYLATGQDGNGLLNSPAFGGVLNTVILAPSGTIENAGMFGTVVRADDKWFPLLDEETSEPVYHGALPPGDYEVWVQLWQGPDAQHPANRAPELGLYKSNRVNLSVVPDGQALTPGKRLRQASKDADTLLSLRGRLYANSKGLSGYGIETKVGASGKLSMTKGLKRVCLALGNNGAAGVGKGPFLRAVPLTGSKHFLIPLEPAAKKLGLKLKADKKGKVYDLVALK